MLGAGPGYGDSAELAGTHINLEFVSANPTGPIHIGGTRWAAVGDALGRLLSTQGAEVVREYYFNDHGAQIDRFARSLVAAAKGEPAPEDGYAGDYIADIAAKVLAAGARRAESARRRAAGDVPVHRRRPDVHPHQGLAARLRHRLRRVHPRGLDAHQRPRRRGHRQAARDRQHLREGRRTWLRTTEFGDDKDRVVIKSDGNPAYVAGDLAYYLDKRQRGFDLCIYMLGADHHGYIARLKAAAAALGDDPDTVEVLIGQMVNLVRDGQPVRMSKRAGTVITLDDLVDAIGVDAARYALIRSPRWTRPIDIDLALWSSASSENPVYYVQYAHARLSALARNAAELGIAADTAHLELLTHDQEGTLIRTLGEFPRVLKTAAVAAGTAPGLPLPRRPRRRLPPVLRLLPGAAAGRRGARRPARARGWRCAQATRQVIANGLAILGVSAPERM